MIARDALCLTAMSIYLWLTNRSLGIKFRPTRAGIRALSHLSTWTSLAFLNDALVSATTPFFVGLILGKDHVPVVTVSRAMWELLYLLLIHFINGLLPGIAHLKGEGNERGATRIANQVLLIAFSGFVVGAAVLWAFNAEFVRLWMGEKFYAGAAFNVSYGLATAFSVLTTVVCQVALSVGEIRGSSLCRTAIQSTRVLAMVVLLAPLGVWAVPLSALVSLALVGFLLLRLWRSSVLRSAPIPWNALLRGARLLGFGAAAGAASKYVLHPANWVELAMSVCATFLVVSCCVIIAEPALISTAKQIVATVFRRPQAGLKA
jgi:O-antigen/teichoic acid export membrane protein